MRYTPTIILIILLQYLWCLRRDPPPPPLPLIHTSLIHTFFLLHVSDKHLGMERMGTRIVLWHSGPQPITIHNVTMHETLLMKQTFLSSSHGFEPRAFWWLDALISEPLGFWVIDELVESWFLSFQVTQCYLQLERHLTIGILTLSWRSMFALAVRRILTASSCPLKHAYIKAVMPSWVKYIHSVKYHIQLERGIELNFLVISKLGSMCLQACPVCRHG